MSKLSFAVGLSCVTLLIHPVLAEDQPAVPTTPEPQTEALIESLNVISLSEILTEAGAEEVLPSAADSVVRFKSGGRNYFVALSACEEETHLCALATIGRAIKGKLPLELLNKINEKYNGLISATRVNETTFKLVHATIIGGGVSRKNLAVNFVWYVNETPEFENFVKSQLVAENPASRPDIQPVSAGLPLGDVVLSPAEISALVQKLQFPNKSAPLKVK